MAKSRLEEIREVRLEKMQKLRDMGIDPFPIVSFDKTQSKKITESFDDFEGKEVIVAGRLMGWREHGVIAFGHLQDEDGIIQIFVKEEELSPTDSKQGILGYSDLNLIDVGDIIYAKGKVTKTVRGEISITPSEIKLLTKSLNPLPDKWHGLKDIEERYRKRYLDMIMNPSIKDNLNIRSMVIDCIRDYLTDRGFIEVETPTLQPIYGGGFAKPFKTHHNALDSVFYLRISDEMYLKRLIVGGMEKVFEITKVFRNEGVDRDHNPEFTMFEAMTAYKDYQYGMDTIEEIFEYTTERLFGTTEVKYQGTKLSFKKPWKRLKMVEAIEEYTGLKPLEWKTIDEAKEAARSIGIKKVKLDDLDRMFNIGEVIAFVFEESVEEKLVQPTIIYDYPVENSPLAKKCEDERFTQRFEMFAMGSELGNNYTELNDPVDLRQRFIEEKKREEAGFDEAHQTDYDYLEAIEYGFPPTCGIAIGVDRMVMLLTDSKHIKEIIPFPTLKPLHHDEQESIETSGDDKARSVSGDDPKSGKDTALISDQLKNKFPGISFAYTTIKGVSIKKKNEDLELLKKKVIENIEKLTMEEIRELTPISSYKIMLKETGVDVGSRMPSPEALLKRIVKGKGLYTINTAVDAYNVAVMETAVGLGGFDAKYLEFPVELRFSKDGEEMKLLGEDSVTKTQDGEIIYSDKKGPITLDLNYRDIDRTKITLDTKDIVLFADGGPGIEKDVLINALQKGAEYIKDFCGGKIGEIQFVS